MGKDSNINFKCVYCGNIYGSIKGICAHITQKHKKKFSKGDFKITSENALPLAYGRSRSKNDLRKEIKYKKMLPNFECIHCGKVYKSRLAMAAHIKGAHNKSMTINDYTRTAKPPIIKKKRLK